MPPTAFLDTNVILRHVLGDHPSHSPAATRLFERIEAREQEVRISDSVVFETVFTLEKLYTVPRAQIEASILPILELPGVERPGKSMMRNVFRLWVNRPSLSFADCYHLELAKRLGLNQIISFDRGLKGVDGITRIES